MPDTAANPPLEAFLSIAVAGSYDFLQWLEIFSDPPADASYVNNSSLFIIYTWRGQDIRIISAWKASKHERETYTQTRTDRPL